VAWEKRGVHRYYDRGIRRDGRTEKVYVGTGPAAELAARLDARARRDRAAAEQALMAERDRRTPAELATRDFESACDLLESAILIAAGYHRHRSGPWRRRRSHG
jgi:hypothetical protein